MGFDNLCNTTLVLSLNIQSNTLTTPSETTTTQSSPKSSSTPHKSSNNNNNNSFFNSLEPSLTLGLSGGGATPTATGVAGGGNSDRYRQASPNSAVSSFSNVSVKRERDFGSEEVEVERGSARIVDEDEDSFNTRKKLRLTKEQSALLEDSFKEHSTLNPKQKQALARQLNLRPRQVEVWFQNRRARTKLKQTEVDCEFLKKCCETLTDENKRLHKELQELKALKLAQPFYMQIPAATLSMCPSCERITGTGGEAVAKTPIAPFAIAAAKSHHHLYNPFTNPSAAC